MIKLSCFASMLIGIAWLLPSRAGELADQPSAGADRSLEVAYAQSSTTNARRSRPQRVFVPMDFKRMFTAGPLSDPQPPSTLLPAGAVTVDLTLRAATPTLCKYSVGKDLPFDQMTPFDTAAPSSPPRTIVRGLDAAPGQVNDVYIRSARLPRLRSTCCTAASRRPSLGSSARRTCGVPGASSPSATSWETPITARTGGMTS